MKTPRPLIRTMTVGVVVALATVLAACSSSGGSPSTNTNANTNGNASTPAGGSSSSLPGAGKPIEGLGEPGATCPDAPQPDTITRASSPPARGRERPRPQK